MILDAEHAFALAQAITTTGVSTNVIDLKAIADTGAGFGLQAQVVTAFTSGTSPTLQVEVQQSSTEAFGSPVVLAAGHVHALADLTAGKALTPAAMPAPTARFLRLRFVVTSGSFTNGRITAVLRPSADPASPAIYPSRSVV